MLELKGIVKRFGDVVANRDVTLAVEPGEVRGIVGENGAGKTTLMAIASGLYRPDAGSIAVDGSERTFRNRIDALAAGIDMVHQHFMLVHNLSVAQNVVLGARGNGRRTSLREVSARVRELGDRYGLPVEPDRRISELSPGEQQRVEILTALYRGSRILILDEPTSVLAPPEVESLFATVRRLAGEGRSVLFISHKLDEVLGLCDRISVMRAGELRDTVARGDADARLLARLMVGEEVAERAHDVRPAAGEPLLEVRGASVRDERGRSVVDGVDLEVHPREILGLAGVEGNGQGQLVEAIAGLRPLAGGEIRLGGRDLAGLDAGGRARLGVAHVPEDPRRDGLALALPVWWNLGLRRYRAEGRGWAVDAGDLRRRAAEAIERFQIRGATPETQTSMLSGGNQQKVVLARELAGEPDLLLVVNPTTGLDVAATRFVYRVLDEERDRGAAVLVVSSDLDELETICDRIAVMYGGRVAGVVAGGAADRERLGLLMGGAADA